MDGSVEVAITSVGRMAEALSPESEDEAYLQEAIAEFDCESQEEEEEEEENEVTVRLDDLKTHQDADNVHITRDEAVPSNADVDSPLQGERVLFEKPSHLPRQRPASAMPSRKRENFLAGEDNKTSQKTARPQSASVARKTKRIIDEKRPSIAAAKAAATRTTGVPSSMMRTTHVASEALLRPRTAGGTTMQQTKSGFRAASSAGNFTYKQLRKREDGWDAEFVRGRSLEEPVRGSGPRALASLKKSKMSSSGTLRPLSAGGLARISSGTGSGASGASATIKKKKKKKKKQLVKRRPLSNQGAEMEVLCGDISSLWEQLHIPKRDRDFFRKTYFPRKRPCNRPAPAVLARMREQLHLLKEHRQATLAALRVIQDREAKLETLLHLMIHSEQTCCTKTGANGTGPACDAEATKKSKTKDDDNDDDDDADKKIHQAVRSLRKASIAVVQEIEKWRALLWRPHPFNFLGSNYLSKMQTDAKAYRERMDHRCRDTVFFTDAKACSHEEAPEGISLKKLLQVVKQEALLQCELRGEHKRLLSAGYYIPMLRWRPDEPAIVPEHLPVQQAQIARELGHELTASANSADRRVETQSSEAVSTGALESSKNHLHMLQQLRRQVEAAANATE
ncbi:Hypothetical Protein FCC1311_091512 [Hondaea fermentalgiana]|uniref:Uncharacterized protein n=1 Tax=Hondaea fermentalgiana TaxID=2315210 RepID=A0A2R5GQP2_9STRA|nr:Hypothetical Protein FCC1311_091512 [Hondaea fermentalgiana]|eukprot:GBG32925.1 Hypothetical Protein FCC1311_091512 [Hondaea fermentalgiana]